MSSNVSREFSEEGFSKMADEFNRGKENIPLSSMGGQIVEVEIPLNGDEVEVPHSLKQTPKYMIVLRKRDAVIIYDGVSPWNDKTIFLKATIPSTPIDGGTYPVTFFKTVPVVGENDIVRVGNTAFGQAWELEDLSGSVAVSGGSVEDSTETVKITIMLMRG